jgi:hypothetical protein
VNKTLMSLGALALVATVAVFAFSAESSAPGNFLGEASNDYHYEFLQFIVKFGRQYSSREEYLTRFNNFQKQFEFITGYQSNSIALGLNQFSDLSDVEFNAMLGLSPNSQDRQPRVMPNGEIKAEVDWRKEGTVTAVKNQGACGSCWAFGAIAPLEHIYKQQGLPLENLSEQHLVECSWNEGNNGCKGGWFDWAWEYNMQKGVAKDKDYPYTATDYSSCKAAMSMGRTTRPSGYVLLENSSKALLTALNTIPVAVAVGVNDVFRNYQSGIMTPEDGCLSWMVNHAVTAVGYGTEGSEQYYITKNSWGSGWGENGYMKVSTRGNTCGIHTKNAYPKFTPHA